MMVYINCVILTLVVVLVIWGAIDYIRLKYIVLYTSLVVFVWIVIGGYYFVFCV